MSGQSQGGVASTIGSFIGMIILHGLLLIIHRSGISRPRGGQPSPGELIVGITIFCALQRCIGRILAGIGAILSIGLSEFAARHRGQPSNQEYASLRSADMLLSSIWNGVTSLFETVVFTYCLHLGVIFTLDIGIPFWLEFRKDPQNSVQKLNGRLIEVLSFLETTFQTPFSDFLDTISGQLPKDYVETKRQSIHLERRLVDYQKEGQRRLSWSIVVDKDAMDEIKETLGPPGGFGELGFSIARDGVRFEAMGVGTSFNLMFKPREDETEGKLGSRLRGKSE